MSEDQMEARNCIANEQNKRIRSYVDQADNAQELLKTEHRFHQLLKGNGHLYVLDSLFGSDSDFDILTELNEKLQETAPSVAELRSLDTTGLSVAKYDLSSNEFDPSAAELDSWLNTYGLSVAQLDSLLNERGPSVSELDRIIARHPGVLMSSDDHDPYTKPLHVACSFGHSYKLIELLIRRNPDVLHIPDKDGNLPVHLVLHNDILDNECYWFRVKEKALLLKLMIKMFPLSVQHQNNQYDTPLHLTLCLVSQGDLPIALFIAVFEEYFPLALHLKNKFGETPFHSACDWCMDLYLVKSLYTAFPLAARWRNNDGVMPFYASTNTPPAEVIEYVATECSPAACLMKNPCRGLFNRREVTAETSAVLEHVSREAVSALIDVVFYVKHILPDVLTSDIANKVEFYLNTLNSSKVSTRLPLDQYSELILDESARSSLDTGIMRTLVEENEGLQGYLKDDALDELHELLDNVVRMNRAGRLHFNKDPNDRRAGIRVLQAAGGLSAFFFHLRENPALCKHF